MSSQAFSRKLDALSGDGGPLSPEDERSLAEFLRLYEHYRARARLLAADRGWATKHYTPGTPESKARERMLSLG